MRNEAALDSPNLKPFEREGRGAIGAILTAVRFARGRMAWYASAATGALLIARGVTGWRRFARWRKARGMGEVRIRKAVTILRPPGEIYGLFRRFELLPEFMLHIKSVTLKADGTWHWVVFDGLLQLEWDVQIVDDIPGERIEWRSLPGGDVEHAGSLELASEAGGRGTVVHLSMFYRPPGGVATGALRALLASVNDTVFATELHRMKQLLEAGELATSERRGQRAGAALVSNREDHHHHASVVGALS